MDEDRQVRSQHPDKSQLYAKMARVMGRLSRVNKSGNNTYHNYAYATDADVSDAVREAMAAENLALLVSMVDVQWRDSGVMVHFNFTLACGDTGASETTGWYALVNGSGKNDDKVINKAATNGLKYFLLKTFVMSTGDPADDSDSHPNTPDIETAAPRIADKPAQPKSNGNATKNRVIANDFNAWCKQQQFDTETVLKALKVKRLGEYDWLADGALETAKTIVHAYYADNQLGQAG